MQKLDLFSAAKLLAELTQRQAMTVGAIIRAGAENVFHIYWFNDLRTGTYIADFSDAKVRDLRASYSDGPQRMTHSSLRELAVAESITVLDFQCTNDDFALLVKIKGWATDDDGNLLGYRHPATADGTVNISRDQLFVYEHELRDYAAPGKDIAASACTPWRISEPTRYTGYRHELFMELKRQLAAGAPRPGAHQILDAWRAKTPTGFVMGHNEFTYPTSAGKSQSKSVSVRSLQRAIDGLCKAQ